MLSARLLLLQTRGLMKENALLSVYAQICVSTHTEFVVKAYGSVPKAPFVNVYQQRLSETGLLIRQETSPLPQLPGRGSSVPSETRVSDLHPAGVWHVHVHACMHA